MDTDAMIKEFNDNNTRRLKMLDQSMVKAYYSARTDVQTVPNLRFDDLPDDFKNACFAICGIVQAPADFKFTRTN